MIKLLIGGSPCTFWSIARSQNREITASGMGWELFLNYLIAKEKFQPNFFLYENNWSASNDIKKQIENELQTKLIHINSSLVSAQNRDRFYVCNWTPPMPDDKNIILKDIIENKENGALPLITTTNQKSFCVTATEYKGSNVWQTITKHRRTMIAEPSTDNKKTTYTVKNSFININNTFYKTELPDGTYAMRKLSAVECARLQTLPDNYASIGAIDLTPENEKKFKNKIKKQQAWINNNQICFPISQTNQMKGYGNGWTAEIIIHLLKHGLNNIPRNEKIIVLSMYDGIGTGYYCLKQLGFTNIEYHAYEIDETASSIARYNHPDIIHHGDAFQLRHPLWTLERAI